MASPRRECDSGFDKILKNTEFENDQQIRAIKAESEKIRVYETQFKEKLAQIAELENSISGIDERTKQLQKQFSINNDNCESLKRTATVLADHDEALKAKLVAMVKEVEAERIQQRATLDKYCSIWDRYRIKYDSFEKVNRLQSEKAELQTLLETNNAIDMQLGEAKGRLYAFKHKDDDKLSLMSVVLKIAQLDVETQKNKYLARTESKQILQMQQEIDTLQSKAEKLVWQDQQRQRDKNEYSEKKITSHSYTNVEAMEVENCAVEEQPVNMGENLQNVNEIITSQVCIPVSPNTPHSQTTPQRSSVSNIPVLGNPCSLFTPTPSAPQTKQTPLRYRFEMPKLCTPPRMSGATTVSHTVHPSTTLMASSIAVPPTPVISSSTAPTSIVPSVTVDTTSAAPRPVFPRLHTPTQSRGQLSFTPQQTDLMPSVSLSCVQLARQIPSKQPKTMTSQSSLSLGQQQQPSRQSQSSSVPQNNTHACSLPNNAFVWHSQPSKVTGQPLPPLGSSSSGQPQPPSSLGHPLPQSSNLSQPLPPVRPSGLGQPQPPVGPFSLGQPLSPVAPSSLEQSQPFVAVSSLGQPQHSPVSTTASVLDDTVTTYNVGRSNTVQDGSHVPIEQTKTMTGNPTKTLLSERDNYCVNTPTHSDARLSSLEDSRNDSGVTSDPQSYLFPTDHSAQYSTTSQQQASDYQEADRFSKDSQEQPTFTGNEESQMYYNLEGQVASNGDEPTAVVPGRSDTSSVFMEGFRFDQESANTYHNDTHGQFNLFGSDHHVELPGGDDGSGSGFSFSFGENNDPSNTGSFFF